jgi:hypothetical protein
MRVKGRGVPCGFFFLEGSAMQTSSQAVAAFLRPFGSKRPEVERPTFGRLPVAFPLPYTGEGQGWGL